MTIQHVAIIDTTLREGEQFASAHFTTAQKQIIARALDRFGVDAIEITNPAASPRSFADARLLAAMPRRAMILAHVRCTVDDVQAAIDAGVDGVNLFYGMSDHLRTHSHGHSIATMIACAEQCIRLAQAHGLVVRFSSEDGFRTDRENLLAMYRAVDALGVDRIGIADTVGIATPRQVEELVATLRRECRAAIEFHGHNDSGCAIANAHAALDAGATFIDTTVLGIGERNGITPLGGLIARLYATDPALTAAYDLPGLRLLDALVAEIVGVPIPFNNYLTGATAFTHKAGVHTKAVLADPHTYEIFDPATFGVERTISVAHALTGRAAIADRARTLGFAFDAETICAVTAEVKRRADDAPITDADVDGILQSWTVISGGGFGAPPGQHAESVAAQAEAYAIQGGNYGYAG
ncbi:MAG: homocitrate synthase [Chloroflexota bacterium]|nr:homocitrate synthase [Chloroflexota bacterium]